MKLIENDIKVCEYQDEQGLDRRIFYIDTGNTSSHKVNEFVEKIKAEMSDKAL